MKISDEMIAQLVSDYVLEKETEIKNLPISDKHAVEVVKKLGDFILGFYSTTKLLSFPMIFMSEYGHVNIVSILDNTYFFQIEVLPNPKSEPRLYSFDMTCKEEKNSAGFRKDNNICFGHFLGRDFGELLVPLKDRKFYVN